MAGRVPEVPGEPQTEKAVWQEQTVERTEEEAAAKKKGAIPGGRSGIKRILRSRRPPPLSYRHARRNRYLLPGGYQKSLLRTPPPLNRLKPDRSAKPRASILVSSTRNERRRCIALIHFAPLHYSHTEFSWPRLAHSRAQKKKKKPKERK